MGQGAATALPIVGGFLQQVNQDDMFHEITNAKFTTLSYRLMEKLDCELSKSDRNFFQRLFNKKKGTKHTQFKENKKRKKLPNLKANF